MQCSTEQLKVVGKIGRLAGARPDRAATSDVLDLLRSLCHFEAANLVRWDAACGRHVGVDNSGYDAELDRYFVERFPLTVPSRRIVSGRVPLRIDDEPYDFRETDTYLEQLQPRGFDDGMTTALFTDDDVYVGMLNMSSERPRHFDNDLRDLVAAVSFLVASVVDATAPAPPPPLLNWLGHDEPHMTIVRAAGHFAAGVHSSLRTVWHHDGAWQSVEFVRAESAGHVDVTAVPREVPYGLTRRELQIATAIAMGLRNKGIAASLHISPRTVGKHIERLLAKLGCASRFEAAAICVHEGVIDLDLVVDGGGASRLLGRGATDQVRSLTY